MWKLAWRNLWRNRTRTFILVTAVSLTYAMMLSWIGIGDDLHGDMEEAAAESAGGSVLVHGDGYWQSQSTHLTVAEPGSVQRAAERISGVRDTVPRVLVNGLLSSPHGNAPSRVQGIVPAREAKLRDLAEYVVAGEFLSGEYDHPIVLGTGLVEKLDVELGDKVVLTASDADGDLTRALFRLRGIVETGVSDIDDSLAMTRLETAQQALGMGSKVHQIGILIEEGLPTDRVAAGLEEQLGEGGEALEILTWQEAMPEMVGFIQLDNATLYIYLAIIFIIVAFVIANTFLMSVMERVREFGLFSALGLNDRRVGELVLAETVLLAGVALTIGLGLGASLHLLVDTYGIDLAWFGSEQMDVSGVALRETVVRSEIRPVKWIVATGAVFATILVSAFYPAWKAMRLAPSKAMEFYEM